MHKYGPRTTFEAFDCVKGDGYNIVTFYTVWDEKYMWEVSYCYPGDEEVTYKVINHNGTMTEYVEKV